MIDVTIAVPADRAKRFKDHAKRRKNGNAYTEWRAGDHDLAAELWKKLNANAGAQLFLAA